jgi:hypothetical protein
MGSEGSMPCSQKPYIDPIISQMNPVQDYAIERWWGRVWCSSCSYNVNVLLHCKKVTETKVGHLSSIYCNTLFQDSYIKCRSHLRNLCVHHTGITDFRKLRSTTWFEPPMAQRTYISHFLRICQRFSRRNVDRRTGSDQLYMRSFDVHRAKSP